MTALVSFLCGYIFFDVHRRTGVIACTSAVYRKDCEEEMVNDLGGVGVLFQWLMVNDLGGVGVLFQWLVNDQWGGGGGGGYQLLINDWLGSMYYFYN